MDWKSKHIQSSMTVHEKLNKCNLIYSADCSPPSPAPSEVHPLGCWAHTAQYWRLRCSVLTQLDPGLCLGEPQPCNHNLKRFRLPCFRVIGTHLPKTKNTHKESHKATSGKQWKWCSVLCYRVTNYHVKGLLCNRQTVFFFFKSIQIYRPT